MKRFNVLMVLLLAIPGAALAAQSAASASRTKASDVVLVTKGKATSTIYVTPAVMAPDVKLPAGATSAQIEAETQRRRLRESVNDLALYLQRMSGAKVAVRTAATPADVKPQKGYQLIYIGALAERKFGPTRRKEAYQQGFRVVVSPQGIGLMGESDESASYAIYELLHRLGCRWYIPSETGEEIPQLKTIALPVMDLSSAPGTWYRTIWYADEDFKRRNRMGGFAISAAHATFDDAAWKTTRPGVDTWAAMGIPNYFGPMWYRTRLQVPAVPAGKKVYLWVSREDGNIKLWVNGQHIPYVNDKGVAQEEFQNGYGTPISFDITAAVKPGNENQITIRGTRVFINELGTGGLLGPVLLYQEK